MDLIRIARCSAAAAATFFVAASACAANWTITDLGTLGGTSSQALALNNRGQVVGVSRLAGDVSSHAFLYTNGSMYDLGTLGGDYSEARGINNSGQVVGVSSLNGELESRGFIYGQGQMQSIGTLYPDAAAPRKASWANAVNNRGQVVGASNLPVSAMASLGTLFAIKYERGSLARISEHLHEAMAINDRGDIVGVRYNKDAPSPSVVKPMAMLYRQNRLIELGTLSGLPGSWSVATAINNAGDIVGRSGVNGSTSSQAFLYRQGKLIDLGAQLGFASSEATGINNAGTIVGTGALQAGTAQQPFIARHGQLTLLNALPEVTAAGWVLTTATAINDAGQVVGTGTVNGQQRAYMLSPYPTGANR